jgi:hypothetical protein
VDTIHIVAYGAFDQDGLFEVWDLISAHASEQEANKKCAQLAKENAASHEDYTVYTVPLH